MPYSGSRSRANQAALDEKVSQITKKRSRTVQRPLVRNPIKGVQRTLFITLGLLALLAILLTATFAPSAVGQTPGSAWRPAAQMEKVRILGLGEFNGALERPTGFQGQLRDGSGNMQDAGGAAHLAATVAKLRDQVDGGSLLLSTGDSIGGTDTGNALLNDRPTIEFLNRLQVNARL